ncbi:MAG TPA: hypothetical protein VJ576_20440 [Rhodocyclaceae bacterium]|nr:hypothetical protein [Rhodocyclaceae bacterium]
MADSNITGEEDVPLQPPGHSTADLGPSDTSDSGSDIAGAPGTANDAGLGDDASTTSDLDRGQNAGPDLGDIGLDSDTDAGGTGERMAAGRDADIEEGADIAPDRITRDPGGMVGGEDPEGIGVSSGKDKKG